MKCTSIAILCALFLVSCGIFALTPGPATAQDEESDSNAKIVVIYKGKKKKDPETRIFLDNIEQGILKAEAYLEMPVSGGSHNLTVGIESFRSVRCSRSLGSGRYATATSSFDHMEMPFKPAKQKVDLKELETIYIQIEKYKPPTMSCDELMRSPDQLINFKVREIKEKDGKKLMKKYKK